jgi:hypothetical protein
MGRLVLHVEEGNACALPRESSYDGFADSRGPAGYEDAAALEARVAAEA